MVRLLNEQLNQHKQKCLREAEARSRYQEAAHRLVDSTEEMIRSALDLFGAIGNLGRAVQALPESERLAQAPQVVEDYKNFYDESQEELKGILELEKKGYCIARSDEYKAAIAEARVYGYQSERLLKANQSLNEGKHRPLEEVMDELRHRDERRSRH